MNNGDADQHCRPLKRGLAVLPVAIGVAFPYLAADAGRGGPGNGHRGGFGKGGSSAARAAGTAAAMVAVTAVAGIEPGRRTRTLATVSRRARVASHSDLA